MASIIEDIPNLVNGVSQQAASLRFPSQAEVQENGLSKIGTGLKKRPPLEYIAKLTENTDDLTFVHTIDRDETEQYKVVITSTQFEEPFSEDFSKGSLRIFDIVTGVEQTVTGFSTDNTYLNSTNPRDTISILTVADTSFILNKSVVVAKDSLLSPDRAPEGIMFLKSPTANSNLDVYVDGALVATIASADSRTAVDNWDADLAATGIKTTHNTFKTVSSNIWLTRNDKQDFGLHATGPEANVIAFKDTADAVSSLPQKTKDGFTIEIVGDTGSDADNYWVKHVNPNDTGTGKWIETVKPGLTNKLDASTLPVKLIRNPFESFADPFSEDFGTSDFSIVDIEWDERVAGDETSNPDPSFIGETINDIFFYKNRLGLLAGENILLSELGNFFNFYFTTLTTLPATDPIDLAAPSNRVSILESAVPFDGGLLLFSNNAQFSLQESSSEGLTPESARLDEISQYEHESTTKPILVGRKVYYGENRDGFSTIREFGLIEDLQEETAEDITAHVPAYIDGTVRRIASSVANNLLFVQTSERLNELAIYSFLWERGQKVVSSWSKWILPEDEAWLEVGVIDSVAYFVIKRPDGTHLSKMSLQDNKLFLERHDSAVELEFKPMLDFQQSSIGVYDEATEATTWTLPYSDDTVVGVYDFGWGEISGTRVEGLTLLTGLIDVWSSPFSDEFGGADLYTSISKEGNHVSSPITFGRNYTLKYQFTEPHLTVDTNNGVQNVSGDRLHVRDFGIRYENTAEFLLRVKAQGRTSRDYQFNARMLGSPSNTFGAVVFETGLFRKLVMSKNHKLELTIIHSEHTPATFLSAFWSGEYFSRARNRRLG